MRAQRFLRAIILGIVGLAGWGSHSTRAATFSLKAVKVNDSSIPPAREINAYAGDVIVAECYLSGWEANLPGGGLDTYQFTIDGAVSYFSGTSGSVLPVGYGAPLDLTFCSASNPGCPPATPDCRYMLDGSSRCTLQCDSDTECTPEFPHCAPESVCVNDDHDPDPYAFVDASRSDFVHFGANAFWAVRNDFTIQYAYGSTSLSFDPVDTGVPKYVGTLTLKVSDDASGRFSIQFDDTIREPLTASRTFVTLNGPNSFFTALGEPLVIEVVDPKNPPGGGATFSLKAVTVNGTPIPPTNLVYVYPGDVIGTECYVSGWNANVPGGGLDTYQFTIDGINSYFSGTNGRVFPVGYGAPIDLIYCSGPGDPICPPETPDCRYMLDGTRRCTHRCSSDAECPPEYPNCLPEAVCVNDDHDTDPYAFVDASRTDFVHFGANAIWAVRNDITIQYAFGCTAASFDPVDTGVPKYAGTLALQASADAMGTFLIRFDDTVRDPVTSSHTFVTINGTASFFAASGVPLTVEVIDPQNPPNGGATFSLKAVAVNGLPISPTNVVGVRPGASIVAEVFLSGWNENQPGGKLGTYQFTIDGGASYLSGTSGRVYPVGYDAPWDLQSCTFPDPMCPLETPDCRDMLDGTSRCTDRCLSSADCPAGFPTCGSANVCNGPGHVPDTFQFIDLARPDFVFSGMNPVAVVRNDFTIQFAYGATILATSTPVVEDSGDPFYVGTLTLGVSDDATGSFAIGIDEGEGLPSPSRSFVEIDESGNVFRANGAPLNINVVIVEPIPTVSGWGLLVLALVLLTGVKVWAGRQPSHTRINT